MFQYFFDYTTVRTTHDMLVRLLRIIFYRRKITVDDFVRYHSEYWIRWNRGDALIPESIDRNNQRRTILNDKITWGKFRFVISDLLRLDIKCISITVRDSNGELVVYSSDDEINIADSPSVNQLGSDPDLD